MDVYKFLAGHSALKFHSQQGSQPLQLVTLAFEHVQWQRTDEMPWQ